MLGMFRREIETGRPKGRGSGSQDIDSEHVAEQKPLQQKIEGIGNGLLSGKGGKYQKVE